MNNRSTYIYSMLTFLSLCMPGNITAQTLDLNKAWLDLQFIIGTWKIESGAEMENGNLLEKELRGKGFALNGRDTILKEVIQLVYDDSGIHYIAKVKGQNNNESTISSLVNTQKATFVFENKAHDFPQRINYRKISDTLIMAWIEGEKNGEKKKMEYPMKRIN
ncbi:MAG: hypothetical protein IPI60_17495 [Saprospiraceae bacterium]|nr:hypothetical protein [Saprospiraceae bacterium]